MIEGVLLDEDRAGRIDEDASSTVVTHEVAGKKDSGRTGKVLHADPSLGRVVSGEFFPEGDPYFTSSFEALPFG